ncbi:hypothetical protein SAMN03159453_05157 [Pseudomonas sp. NFIX28]|nr:hypothetical protein SAMN03159453_05157 [Pseudomonas sp. NFIX28]
MRAMSVQLISLLQGQGYSLAAAVGLSALLGPSQVGSRVLQVFSRKRHPIWTTLISVIFVAMGLLFVTTAPAMTALGLVIYGAGNGLRAIVRGLLPLALMSPTHYVLLMGRMARPALIGQALPPLAGGYLLQTWGAGGVLAGLSALECLSIFLGHACCAQSSCRVERHYSASYQDLREEHARFAGMTDKRFLRELPAALHFAVFVC